MNTATRSDATASAYCAALDASISSSSSDAAFVAALQLSTVRASARKLMVAMLATMKGAERVAVILSAYAGLNMDELKAHAKARAAGEKASTPECVSAYVQIRREAEKAGHPFTIAKRGGTDAATYVATERGDAESKKKAEAASGPRKGRKVTEPRADITDNQAMKQVRALLHLNSTSNRETLAALAALLAPAPAARTSKRTARSA